MASSHHDADETQLNSCQLSTVEFSLVSVVGVNSNGSPENAGLENDGQKKSRGWKMQDWKYIGRKCGLEFDGLAMRVRVRKTQVGLAGGSCKKHQVKTCIRLIRWLNSLAQS